MVFQQSLGACLNRTINHGDNSRKNCCQLFIKKIKNKKIAAS